MRPLSALTRRDLRLHAWRLFGLALLVTALVATLAGRARARAQFVETRTDVYARLARADVELRCRPIEPAVLLAAADQPGVVEAECRLLAIGVLRHGASRPLPCLVRVLPPSGSPRIDALEVLAGRLPRAGERAAVVDRALSRDRGVELGDEIEITVRSDVRRVPVVGVCLSPEHLVAPIHPLYVLPMGGTVGVIAISPAVAEGVKDADRANSLLLRLEPGHDVEQVIERVSAAGVSVIEAVPARAEPCRRFTDMVLANFDAFTPAVLGVVAGAAGILIWLVLGRLVRRERRRVGILLAHGYSPLRIACSFLTLALVPTALGAVFGTLAHTWIADVLVGGITRPMGFVTPIDSGPVATLYWSIAVALLVGIAAVWLPAAALGRTQPARALVPQRFDIARLRVGRLIHVAALIRRGLRVPQWMALGVTFALRRRRETLGAAVGLGLAFALVLASLMVHFAHRYEIGAVASRWSRDATIYFDEPMDAPVRDRIADVTQGSAELFVSKRAFLVRDDGTWSQRVLGVETDGLAHDLPIADGRVLSGPGAYEALVDRHLAHARGLAVGDTLDLFPFVNAPEGASVEVVGIVDGISFGRILMPLDVAQSMFDLAGRVNGAHVDSPLVPAALEDAIWTLEHVESTFGTRRIEAEIEAAFEARSIVVRLTLSLSIGYALVFLVVISSLDATDRAPQIALLMSMGWGGRPLFGLLLSEMGTRGLLGLTTGIAFSPFLAAWLASRIESANGYVLHPEAPGWVWVTVVVAALAAFVVAALPAWWSARRQPPARSIALLRNE